MLRKPLLSLLLALVLFAVFAAGIARLFVLRYEIGDIYPPYSSLRTDPLGTKVFAAALDDLPGIEVRRNFKPLPKLGASLPISRCSIAHLFECRIYSIGSSRVMMCL